MYRMMDEACNDLYWFAVFASDPIKASLWMTRGLMRIIYVSSFSFKGLSRSSQRLRSNETVVT